jgi:hypothetical protein
MFPLRKCPLISKNLVALSLVVLTSCVAIKFLLSTLSTITHHEFISTYTLDTLYCVFSHCTTFSMLSSSLSFQYRAKAVCMYKLVSPFSVNSEATQIPTQSVPVLSENAGSIHMYVVYDLTSLSKYLVHSLSYSTSHTVKGSQIAFCANHSFQSFFNVSIDTVRQYALYHSSSLFSTYLLQHISPVVFHAVPYRKLSKKRRESSAFAIVSCLTLRQSILITLPNRTIL